MKVVHARVQDIFKDKKGDYLGGAVDSAPHFVGHYIEGRLAGLWGKYRQPLHICCRNAGRFILNDVCILLKSNPNTNPMDYIYLGFQTNLTRLAAYTASDLARAGTSW